MALSTTTTTTKSKFGYRLVWDVETTGSNLLLCEMPCFGAVIINAETSEIVAEFEVYINPIKRNEFYWEEMCLVEFWDKPENVKTKESMLKRVEQQGVSVIEAMTKFDQWINVDMPKEVVDNLTMYVDTAGYDIQWMSRYLAESGRKTDVSYLIKGKYQPPRDISSFLMGIGHKTPDQGLFGSEKAACIELGIDYDRFKRSNPFEHDHTPLNDAKNIAWSIIFFERVLRNKEDAIMKLLRFSFIY